MGRESVLIGSVALASLFEVGPLAGLSDGELLDRFLERDGLARESAVSALVDRHSAMVWRICRTSVGNDSDASDAFQATFLVLLSRARTIRNRQSVAGWLGGVARKVAANARSNAVRRRVRERAVVGPALVESNPGADLISRELAAIVRDELGRLTDRDRDVVLACDLEGLTETEAAQRLGCPVGTVRSRLHRARTRLRDRFARRGLDPSAALGVLPKLAIDKIPATLAAKTVALAARSGVGVGGWAKVAPAAAALLIDQSGRNLLMVSMIWTSALVVGIAGVSSALIPHLGANLMATSPQDPPRAETPTPKTQPDEAKPALDAPKPDDKAQQMAEQFRAIVAEYDDTETEARKAAKQEKTKFEGSKVLDKQLPDVTTFSRRMNDLALLDPKSKVACNAAIWVIDKPFMGDGGSYGTEFDRAADLIVTYHPDDLDAVRLGLRLSNLVTPHRDAFLQGIYANATSHEAKGVARLAYAQYLDKKVVWVRSAHKYPARSRVEYQGYDANGKLVPMSHAEPNTDLAYKTGLLMINPDAMRAEAERLYKEVIADYGDVSVVNRPAIEAELTKTFHKDGTLVDRSDRDYWEQMLRSKTTLADRARSALYQMTELVIQKPAPDVVGTDLLTDKPFRLADLRGKVVLLLFWSGDDDDELLPVVKKREASERSRGRAFAVLGVACGQKSREDARRLVEKEQLPWPNTFVGEDDQNAIVKAYQIKNVPRAALIDARGLLVGLDIVAQNFESWMDKAMGEPTDAPPK